jgi:hypothetical protein
MKFFIMVQYMSFCCRFKKFFEELIWLPCLAHGVTLGGHDILLVGAVRFLVIVVVVGSNYNPSEAPLSPHFAAIGAFFGAFDDGFRRPPSCCWGPFSHRLEQRRPQPPPRQRCASSDIKQLLGVLWLIMAEFMH